MPGPEAISATALARQSGVSPSALSEDERAELVRVATSPEFRELAPAQILARLADQGLYLASESTFYRVLRGQSLRFIVSGVVVQQMKEGQLGQAR